MSDDWIDTSELEGEHAPPKARAPVSPVPLEDRICLFTDHLDDIPGITFDDIGRAVARLGLAGVDLTVRPGGVIEPDRVAEDLPKAATVFASHGLTIPMLTTDITSRTDVGDILSTARQVGIDYYKLGYMEYGNPEHWRSRREQAHHCDRQRSDHPTNSRSSWTGPTTSTLPEGVMKTSISVRTAICPWR